MKRTILAIDQSFTHTAWVLMTDNIMVDFGVIKTDKTKDVYERAADVSVQIAKLYNQHNVKHLFIEGLAFGIRGSATRDLGGLLFAILCYGKISIVDFKFTILAPTSVKKSATGSGKASKNDMINALPAEVKQRFEDKNFKKTTGLSDLADSFFIYKCGLEALDKV